MKLPTGVLGIALLLLAAPATAQNDQREMSALNNVHYEMCTCIAFYAIAQECVQKSGLDLGAEVAQVKEVKEHLAKLALQMDRASGMTEDATASRVLTEKAQMQTMIRHNCGNMSLLAVRHTSRCKQVVENGDSVFLEYLELEPQ